MLIKICGIKDAETALFAAECGANFIGLVFAEHSKRYVIPEVAKEIVQTAKEKGAQPVAVFSDCTKEKVLSICEAVGIDIVQVHGSPIELPEYMKRIYVNNRESFLREGKDFLLFDHAQAGSGISFDWNSFIPPKGQPWFLAGGLTPKNVKEAIALLNPTGVDVSSGVEKEGKKDKKLIEAFIKEIRKHE